MKKKVAIVTGADGGMGRVITRTLAREGYEVIMACRDIHRATSICQEIRNETASSVQVYPLDLASSKSINAFIKKIYGTHTGIHLLLNNAGVLPHKPDLTEDDIEISAGVNYLGHYYLTRKLIPLMSNGARIVNMASLSYRWFEVSDTFFEAVDSRQFNRFVSYSASKRALVYFTLDYAEILKEKNITINCADPGIVSTNIIRMGNRIIDKSCDWFFRPVIRKPEKGAATMLYLALSPEMEGKTGGYYANQKLTEIPRHIKNSPNRKKLREMTEAILKSRFHQ